jgi:hypothetical protein
MHFSFIEDLRNPIEWPVRFPEFRKTTRNLAIRAEELG